MLVPIVAAVAASSEPPPSDQLPIGRLVWGARRGTVFMVPPCDAVSAKHVAPPGRARIGARAKV